MSKQENNIILDNLAKFFGSTLGAVNDIKNEASAIINCKVENYLESLDLVKREEFLVLKDLVSSLLAEQEELKKKISSLEQLNKQNIDL